MVVVVYGGPRDGHLVDLTSEELERPLYALPSVPRTFLPLGAYPPTASVTTYEVVEYRRWPRGSAAPSSLYLLRHASFDKDEAVRRDARTRGLT